MSGFVSDLRRSLLLSAVIIISVSIRGVRGTTIRLYNTCPFTVWPAWIPKLGHPQLGSGGARLDPWQVFDIYASSGWSGKFWGRTNCQFDTVLGTGCCETGDCSGLVGCNTTFSPPAAFVELNLHQQYLDSYSVSLVEGYNLAIQISATNPACSSAGCNQDVNKHCPGELVVWNARGIPVACNSPCLAFDSDYFCCRNEFAGPDRCRPNQFSIIFKNCCPTAMTYKHDDFEALHSCASGADYTITFCPAAQNANLESV